VKPILFTIGGRPVFAYGFFLSIAFLVGAWLAVWRARRVGLPARHVLMTAAWAFVAAIVGSRLFFILVEEPTILSRPAQWLRVWDGGLVFYGGFFGAVVSSYLYARTAGIPFLLLGDLLAPSIALGHGIVRIGCFLNGCCYGKPAAWGVIFPSLGDGIPRQPTQLYEAAAGVALCLALLLVERRAPGERGSAAASTIAPGRKQPGTAPRAGAHDARTAPLVTGAAGTGRLLFLYVGAYGALRFLIEIARDDDRGPRPLGATVSQLIGLACLGIGLAGWARARDRA
jgi:phosphatidylglycerol---prolipoprotein diacylglyceryl transferase